MVGSDRRQIAVLALVMPVIAATLGTPVSGQEAIERSNWVPNVGSLPGGGQLVGDLWTFSCPPGGSVSVFIDTRDSTDTGQSTIAPDLIVSNEATGILAAGGDDVECTFPPVCGFGCPEVTSIPCGQGTHAIAVFDASFGRAAQGAQGLCAGGGEYDLFVQVVDSTGAPVPEEQVGLGGGFRRGLPRRFSVGVAPVGPALDDEGIPFRLNAQAAAASGDERSTLEMLLPD